ncbi:MAG TPA: hypothetical protein VGS61_05190, partial [Acidimicrobiales bacterium]|nr:hypothetical protein [Acidimicrobiales bacterium]
ATCTTTALPAGTVDVEAVYAGNATYAPSSSAALPFVVAGTGTSTVAVAPSPSTPGAPGSSVMLTATVGAGETGAVLFAYSIDGSTFTTVPSCAAVAVSGTTAVCTTTALLVGTLDVRATYLGNASFATVTSAAVPYAIQKGASTLGLGASPTGRVSFGTSVTLTATAGAGQTGTVAFEYTTNLSTFAYVPGCTSRALSGTTAACVTTMLPRGTRAVVAVYSGDASWSAAASAIVALVVKPLSIKTTLGGFARNSSSLSAGQRAALRAFAARIAAQPFAKVVIRGWSRAALSLARARAVAAYLETYLLADGARVSVTVAAGGSGVTGAVGVTASEGIDASGWLSASARSASLRSEALSGTTIVKWRPTGHHCARFQPRRTALSEAPGTQMVVKRWPLRHRTYVRPPKP